MFKSMRRKEKQMSQQDTIQVLTQAEFGTLACIGKNGYPYSVPVNYVYNDGKIFIHSALEGGKLDSIAFCNKVSFSAVNYHKNFPEKFDSEYDSAIVFGEAALVVDEQEKKHALALLIEKYSRDFSEQGMAYIEKAISTVAVVGVHIRHMTGKRGR